MELHLKGCSTTLRSFMKGDSVFITFPPTAPVGRDSLDAVVQAAWGPERDDEECCLVVKLAMENSNHVLARVVGKTCRVDKVPPRAECVEMALHPGHLQPCCFKTDRN